MSVLIVTALALVGSADGEHGSQYNFTPLLELSAKECPPRVEATSGVPLGPRAIFSDDGNALVIACHENDVLLWRSGWKRAQRLTSGSLFAAAQREAIIPPDVVCSVPSYVPGEPDCDLISHSDDWSVAVLEVADLGERVIYRRGKEPLHFDVFTRFGSIQYPVDAKPNIWLVDGERHPEQLRLLDVQKGSQTLVTDLPFRSSLVSDLGSGPVKVLA